MILINSHGGKNWHFSGAGSRTCTPLLIKEPKEVILFREGAANLIFFVDILNHTVVGISDLINGARLPVSHVKARTFLRVPCQAKEPSCVGSRLPECGQVYEEVVYSLTAISQLASKWSNTNGNVPKLPYRGVCSTYNNIGDVWDAVCIMVTNLHGNNLQTDH